MKGEVVVKIKDIFNQIDLISNSDKDYSTLKVSDELYLGFDQEGNLCLILKSNNQNQDSFSQRTKLLSIQTNQLITFDNGQNEEDGCFHILTCYSVNPKEKAIFVDLCDAYFNRPNLSPIEIVEIFVTLASFFETKSALSDSELQGLFGELFTIYHYRDKLDFAKCWQSKEKLKFDFSISSSIKLEIKTTTKPLRIHSFVHDQLATNIYDVYVLSQKLRFDDSGLNLVILIRKCLSLLQFYPKKMERLIKVLYSCSDDQLRNHTYSENYLISNMRFYHAKNIPHYEDVDGVSNATYNCDFENITTLNEEEIMNIFADNLERSDESV